MSKKEVILKELSQVENDLMKTSHGKFVLKNCKMNQYKQRQEQWQEKEASVEKKRKMFSEILDDDGQLAETNPFFQSSMELVSSKKNKSEKQQKQKQKEEKEEDSKAEESEDEIDQMFKSKGK